MKGIHVASFDCPFTLFYAQFGISIGCCRLLSFSRLFVGLISFVLESLSFLFVLAYVSLPKLHWFATFLFLSLVRSFVRFFVYFSHVVNYSFLLSAPLWVFLASSCLCFRSLQPRNLKLSRRAYQYGIPLYWMATKVEISI